MAFTIGFDYRFDTAGFFDDPARRAALDAAADAWEALIGDAFDPVPAGVSFTVENPENRAEDAAITLADPIDDVLIFVGTADLPDGMAGRGGPDGTNAAGDILAARVAPDFRGTGPVTDFEPWAGSVTFDRFADWGFDLAAPEAGKRDFLSVAVHEIGHVLGIGTSEIFRQTGAGAAFGGVNARAANGGDPVPLTADLAHVADGFAGGGVAMDPTLALGARKLPRPVDEALLADIGYEVPGLIAQGATPPIATEGDDGTIFGTVVADLIEGLGGDDQPQGDAGDDTLDGGPGEDVLFGQTGDDSLVGGTGDDQLIGGEGADTLWGGPGSDTFFGDGGIDLFEIRAGDGQAAIADFDPGAETLRLVDSGFFDAAEALAAVTKPFSNVSELLFADGTRLRVFHPAQQGTPLSESSFELAGTPPPRLSVAALAADRTEGDAGPRAFSFTVSRTGDASAAVGASFAVAGSGAAPADAADFTGGALPAGTVALAPGETSRMLTVEVAGDTDVEPDEGFALTLSDPTGGAGLGTAMAAGVIRNDDAPPAPVLSVAALAADRTEGDAGPRAFSFTVSRTGDASAAVGASFAVTGSGAAPADASDFTGGALPAGTVALAAGETSRMLTVEVAGDTDVEPDEGFALTLSDPTGGAGLGTATAAGVIRNDDAPPAPVLSVAALAADRTEGDAGPRAFSFTVSRTGDASAAVGASFAVAGSGAAPADASDFTGGALPAGTVALAPGETSRMLTVEVAGDTDVEPDEGFALTLSDPTGGAGLGTATAAGVIRNDDQAPAPVLSVAALAADRTEGDAGPRAFSFTVSRTGDASAAVGASFAVAGSGAAPADASDFTGGALPAGTVALAPGETSRMLTVEVAGDTDVEPDEGFALTLSDPTGGAGLGTATAAGVIRNDDAPPAPVLSVAALAADRTEGDAGPRAFSFTVSRTGDASAAVGASFAVAGSGAAPADAADFTGGALPAGTVALAPGETSRMLTVEVAGDTDVEPDEGFALTLSDPTGGAGLGTATAAGVIRNDDAPPAPVLSVAALAADRTEGDAGPRAFSFTVSRTGDASAAVGASFAVAGSGAAPADASDFTGGALPAGMVALAPGETSRMLTVEVAGDTDVEPDEGFALTLSDPTGGAGLGTATAAGVIRNDDAPPAPVLSVAALAADRTEGDAGPRAFSFTVSRTGDASAAVGASFAVAGSGAAPADAADFTGGALPAGTVALAPGETSRMLTVEVAGDTDVEPDEGFTLKLTNPTGGAGLGPLPSAAAIIRNDDAPAQPDLPSGVVRGSPGADVLTVAAGSAYLGGAGEDVYLVSRAATAPAISLLEDSGANTFQLVEGVAIVGSRIGADVLELTLASGAVVRLFNAGSFTLSVGGNVTTGAEGLEMSYETFVASVLGADLPEDGLVDGGSAVIAADMLPQSLVRAEAPARAAGATVAVPVAPSEAAASAQAHPPGADGSVAREGGGTVLVPRPRAGTDRAIGPEPWEDRWPGAGPEPWEEAGLG